MSKKMTLIHALKLAIIGNSPLGAIDVFNCQIKIKCEARNKDDICVEQKIAFRLSVYKLLSKDDEQRLIQGVKEAMVEYSKYNKATYKLSYIIVDAPMIIGGPGDLVVWIDVPPRKEKKR